MNTSLLNYWNITKQLDHNVIFPHLKSYFTRSMINKKLCEFPILRFKTKTYNLIKLNI